MTIKTQEEIAPWYKQFWLWFLIFFPALAVVAGVITIKIAIDNEDSLVRDDYYKAGLAINADLALDKAAAQKNLQAELIIDTITGELQIDLQGDLEDYPSALTLEFYHPTTQSQDFDLELKHSRDGRYISQLTQSSHQRWQLQLSDKVATGVATDIAPSWRLRSNINLSHTKDGRLTLQLTPL